MGLEEEEEEDEEEGSGVGELSEPSGLLSPEHQAAVMKANIEVMEAQYKKALAALELERHKKEQAAADAAEVDSFLGSDSPLRPKAGSTAVATTPVAVASSHGHGHVCCNLLANPDSNDSNRSINHLFVVPGAPQPSALSPEPSRSPIFLSPLVCSSAGFTCLGTWQVKGAVAEPVVACATPGRQRNWREEEAEDDAALQAKMGTIRASLAVGESSVI